MPSTLAPDTIRRRLPNALTGLRLALAPLAAWAWWRALHLDVAGAWMDAGEGARSVSGVGFWAQLALAAFVVAALTDLLDGWLARRWSAQSALGKLVDPIADKLLIGLMLLATALGLLPKGGLEHVWAFFSGRGGEPRLAVVFVAVWTPMLAILVRDIAVTALRAQRGPDGGLSVSALAKWKTALEMVVAGAPPALFLIDMNRGLSVAALDLASWSWLALLWVAAGLSLWTGAAYLRPGPGVQRS